MSINENLFARKVVSEVSGASGRVTEARKVLWCFPVRGERAARGRDLGQQLVAVAFVGDMLVILSALLLTFYIRFQTPIREWGINARPDLSDYLGYIILATVVYIGMLCYGGVYDHRNLLKVRMVTARILKWSVAWVGLILLASFMVKFEPPVSRVYCVMAWVITPSILVSWRSVFQLLLIRTSAVSALRQRVVFVGWNQHSAHLARNFIHSPSSGYQVIGYIHGHADERTEISVPYLGAIEEAERIISSVAIDILILADLYYERQRILQLASACEREKVEFKVVPSYFRLVVSWRHLETVSGIPVLGVSRLPLDRIVSRATKRAIDIVGGTVGLLLSLPIIAVFGTMVYHESPGPIFYRQRRSGRNGKPFAILKIRSLRLDAEQDGKVGWTIQDH